MWVDMGLSCFQGLSVTQSDARVADFVFVRVCWLQIPAFAKRAFVVTSSIQDTALSIDYVLAERLNRHNHADNSNNRNSSSNVISNHDAEGSNEPPLKKAKQEPEQQSQDGKEGLFDETHDTLYRALGAAGPRSSSTTQVFIYTSV